MPQPSRRPEPPTVPGRRDRRDCAGFLAPPRCPDRYSCRQEVGLESFDRDLDCGVGLLAPQFPAGEDHRVEPLWVLARPNRGAIRKYVATANRLDRAELAACVARQTGMCRGMNVLSAHNVTLLEARRGRRRPTEIRPSHPPRIIKGHLPVQLCPGP